MANRVLKFLIIGLLSSVVVHAQDAHPLPRHPGDTVKFEVKFDGPDASKVTTVNVILRLKTAMLPDQSGFSGTFGGDNVHLSLPNSFLPEVKIPDNAANGDYSIDVNASADNGAGSVTYRDGPDFHLGPIHVENVRTFTPPHVTVTEH